MTLFRPMMLAGLCLFSVQAFAQWQWIGSDGRKVYSDRPPPSDVSTQQIIKQPGGFQQPASGSKSAPATRTNSNAPAPTGSSRSARANTGPQYGDIKPPEEVKAAASAPVPAVAAASKPLDKALEAKAKQAEAAEAAKRKAEEDRMAGVRTENCRRANEAKASLNSGMRIAKVNEKGERIVLDNTARAAEVKRADDIIASDCGPMPARK